MALPVPEQLLSPADGLACVMAGLGELLSPVDGLVCVMSGLGELPSPADRLACVMSGLGEPRRGSVALHPRSARFAENAAILWQESLG